MNIKGLTKKYPTKKDKAITRTAVTKLWASNSTVSGTVKFIQLTSYSPVKIIVSIKGLKPYSKHGFHVH